MNSPIRRCEYSDSGIRSVFLFFNETASREKRTGAADLIVVQPGLPANPQLEECSLLDGSLQDVERQKRQALPSEFLQGDEKKQIAGWCHGLNQSLESPRYLHICKYITRLISAVTLVLVMT